MHAVDKGAEVIAGVIQQALTDHHPVADVGGKAQLGELLNDLQGEPRAVQRGGAMGFKAAGQTKPGGQLVRLAEKIDLLRQRPAIVARQQIDKARVEAAGLGEAGLQARQMLLRRFMLGGEHSAAAEKNGDILQPRRLQAVGELPPLGHR